MLQLAASRQSRERQQGVDCSQGYLISTDAGLLFDGSRTLECAFKFIRSNRTQIIANFTSPGIGLEIAASTNGLRIYCGDHANSLLIQLVPETDYRVVVSYNAASSVCVCYLNRANAGQFNVINYGITPYFHIGNSSYPPQGPIYFCRHYNYAFSDEEAASPYNNGDPAGYVLPKTMKRPNVIFPAGIYTPSNAVFNTVSSSVTTVSYDQPHVAGYSGDFMRFDAISSLSLYCQYMAGYLRQPVPIKITCEYRSSTAIYTSQIDPSIASLDARKVADANYGDPIIVSVIYGTGPNYYLFSAANTPDAWLEMRILSIESVGCVAEYLPQNLVTSGLSKQGPVEIIGNNSYTWTGPDDIFSKTITTSQLPVFGQWYRIEGVVSNYEAGTPNVSADSGFTEYALPRANGKFSVLAKCKSTDARPPYSFMFRGGPRGTNRLVTIEVNNIEPVGNIASSWLDSAKQLPLNDEYLPPLLESINGYDLAANGTPEIIYPESSLWYGIEYDVTKGASSCVRIGDMSLHRQLPIQSRMRGCLLDDAGSVAEYLNPDDWTGAVRDGSRGQVMVELPRHYRKHETEGNIRRTKISEYPLPGYKLIPKGLCISAYDASIERSTGKLCSVANSDPDFRGGNDNAAWDGTYRSLLGRPVTQKNRAQFRTAARLRNDSATSEWNCLDYTIYKAVFWLYCIEYANLNCQLAFNALKDADGFAQGGLGAGVTNMPDWSGFNGNNPFVPCGHTDELGNGTGVVAYPVINEDGSIRYTAMVPRYRGIENPFGHIWKWTDGINIRISPTEENGGDGLSKVFVCTDPAKFSDSGYDGYSHVGNEARTETFVKEVIFGEGGEIMASVVGGGDTTYFCDYHYTNIPATETLRGALFGGYSHHGACAGFAAAASDRAPSAANTVIGSRLCFIPKK